jgi:NTP pyrophosphatase (non-canonical NTP hydrolase)
MTHIERVHEWAQARGLYDTDDSSVQFGKAVGELGELIIALANDDIEGIKDGIGDVRVCLINFCKIVDVPFSIWKRSHQAIDTVVIDLLNAFEKLSEANAYSPHQTYLNVEAINAILNDIAHHYGLTLEECDNHAWDQIKDRTGKTINGEFIKDA